MVWGIYYTVTEWPEEEEDENGEMKCSQVLMEKKLEALQHVSKIIKKFEMGDSDGQSCQVDIIDFSDQRKLSIMVNKIKIREIMNMKNQVERERKLRDLMQNIMGFNFFKTKKQDKPEYEFDRIKNSQKKNPNDSDIYTDNFSIHELFDHAKSPESPGLRSTSKSKVHMGLGTDEKDISTSGINIGSKWKAWVKTET